MMGKHYLIYGHGGSYNHGGEAITRCTIEFLRKITPDCFITLSTHFPEQDVEFGIDADEMISRNTRGKTNEEIYKDTLDRITAETTAIQVGGDNYCYSNWQRYAQIHKKAKRCGGKSVLWGCSIEPERLDDEMCESLLEHDLILARESITYQSLKGKGLNNVLQVSDIAFSMESESVEVPAEDYVVINVSPLVCRINPKVIEAAKKLIRFIVDETSLNVVLVPHVVMPMDNDYEVLQILGKMESKRVTLVSNRYSAKQYKYIISHAHFCVAARTHVTIAAYSSGVPTLAIGYSTKAKGIALDLNMSEYVIDISDAMLERKIIEGFKKMMLYEHGIKKEIQAKMKEYKRRTVHGTLVDFLEGRL